MPTFPCVRLVRKKTFYLDHDYIEKKKDIYVYPASIIALVTVLKEVLVENVLHDGTNRRLLDGAHPDGGILWVYSQKYSLVG